MNLKGRETESQTVEARHKVSEKTVKMADRKGNHGLLNKQYDGKLNGLDQPIDKMAGRR